MRATVKYTLKNCLCFISVSKTTVRTVFLSISIEFLYNYGVIRIIYKKKKIDPIVYYNIFPFYIFIRPFKRVPTSIDIDIGVFPLNDV